MNLNVHILESNNNIELYKYLRSRVKLVNIYEIDRADVIIVDKVLNIQIGLEIIDYALMKGKEVICIKNKFGKEYYLCNYLIKDGAKYV